MPPRVRRLDTGRLAVSRLQVQPLTPRFGENYKPGYVGFVYTRSSVASLGIAHFTRWSRMSDMRVSHALVVTGENECVEAVPDKGVVETSLERYFTNPKVQIFFRKPRKCTNALGTRIAGTALAQVGTRSDHLLLAAQMLEGSFLRRWIQSVFAGDTGRFSGRLIHGAPRWMSAELAAYCLDCQPEYAGKGLLARLNYAVDPQELFEDAEIFAAWKNQPAAGDDPESVEGESA